MRTISEKQFQRIVALKAGDSTVKMGCFAGSERVLFIKTGLGGSIYGNENKYLDLAQAINEAYGCTVFVSETESDSRAAYETEMQVVADCFGDARYEIYYLGFSKGGLIGCWYGAENPRLKGLAVVNAPLMINFHNRTVPALQRLGRERIIMAYGTKDPSFAYVPFLKQYAGVEIIDGADHMLNGAPFALREIAERLLLMEGDDKE